MSAADDWNFKCTRSSRNSQSVLYVCGGIPNQRQQQGIGISHKELSVRFVVDCFVTLQVSLFFFSFRISFVVLNVILYTFQRQQGSSHCNGQIEWSWSDSRPLKMLTNAAMRCDAMRYGHIMQWAFGCSQYLTQLQTCSPCSKMRSGFSLDAACKYAKEMDRNRVRGRERGREKLTAEMWQSQAWEVKSKAAEKSNPSAIGQIRASCRLCKTRTGRQPAKWMQNNSRKTNWPTNWQTDWLTERLTDWMWPKGKSALRAAAANRVFIANPQREVGQHQWVKN